MDIGSLMKLRQMWSSFTRNHPKFPDFLRDVKNKGLSEGTELTFIVSYPDGQSMRAGLRLKASDIELLNELLSKNGTKY